MPAHHLLAFSHPFLANRSCSPDWSSTVWRSFSQVAPCASYGPSSGNQRWNCGLRRDPHERHPFVSFERNAPESGILGVTALWRCWDHDEILDEGERHALLPYSSFCCFGSYYPRRPWHARSAVPIVGARSVQRFSVPNSHRLSWP